LERTTDAEPDASPVTPSRAAHSLLIQTNFEYRRRAGSIIRGPSGSVSIEHSSRFGSPGSSFG